MGLSSSAEMKDVESIGVGLKRREQSRAKVSRVDVNPWMSARGEEGAPY